MVPAGTPTSPTSLHQTPAQLGLHWWGVPAGTPTSPTCLHQALAQLGLRGGTCRGPCLPRLAPSSGLTQGPCPRRHEPAPGLCSALSSPLTAPLPVLCRVFCVSPPQLGPTCSQPCCTMAPARLATPLTPVGPDHACFTHQCPWQGKCWVATGTLPTARAGPDLAGRSPGDRLGGRSSHGRHRPSTRLSR